MGRFIFSLPKKQVRRNTIWNIFGQGFPLVLALFFIPPLIKGIGTDKFGALTLVWTFLTYFSLFDLGVGRSLTQLLAGPVREEKKEEADLVWMTFFLLIGLGVLATLILYVLAPLFATRVLHIKGSLQGEMISSLRELAVTFPILIHSLALKGILEAKRRFDLSNIIRLPLGIFTYGAPLLVLPFSHNLALIVALLLAGRILAWLLNLWMVFRIMPHLVIFPSCHPKKLKELLRFGGWITVSSVVVPLIGSMDRIFIINYLSISMLAYYATPFELVSKLWIISAAVGGTIFPEFAARFLRNPAEARTLYMRGFKYLLAVLFPLVLLLTVYAHLGLSLWLNPKFATLGAPVLQWLALSCLISGLSQVPYFFLLGAGRPHIPTLIQLVQLPLYAGLLYVGIKLDGVRGAAIAYTFRGFLEFLALYFFSGAILKFNRETYKKMLLPLAGAMASLMVFYPGIPMIPATALVVLLLGAQGWLSWNFILEENDKATVREKIRALRSK